MNSTKYMQTDSKWGSLPYPKKPCTIRNDGCGEVAVANVIIEMQKYANYTPATIQPYCKQFAAPSCDGTYWSGIPTMMKHYGLTEVKECATMPALWTELAKGNRVAILLMGSRNGGSKKIHWSGSGHFIAVVGYRYKDGDHQVYVKDSYSNLSSRNGWLGYKTHLQGDVLKVWSGKLNGTLATASATPTTTTTTTTTTATKLVVDGIGGTATIKAAQKYFGTAQDGIISGQNKSYKGYYPSIHAVQFGKGGSSLVVAIQKWCGLSGPDGIIGKNTTRGWQAKLRSLGYLPKNETIDGIFGVKSMKAFQNFLNDKLYPSKAEPTPTPKPTTPTTPTTTPTSSSTTVVDVSAFQDAIDWAKVKASGVKGAIVRCGYRGYESGKLNKDSMLENHYKGASKAGLNVGVYFFTEAINAKEGKEEADYAIKLVESTGIKPYYPIVIDTEAQSAKTERAKNLTKAQRTEVIKAFCEEVKAKGYEPMIYASTSWLNNKLDMSKLPYKVWCAQYYTKCEYKGAYVMWQYTSSGKVNGVKGNVDMSHCYLTSASPSPSVASPTKKSIDELAKEVLDGKWGSGETRKKKLTEAGYDYDAVQKRVNEIIESQQTMADKIIAACKTQAEWMKNFKYEWENKPTIEKSKKKGTCVTYVACVLQRVGLLKSGEHIWHNGSGFGTGKVTGNTKNFDVMYMDNKTFTALKSKLKKGDVVLCDDNKSGEKGSGGHIMIFSGQWASNGNPLVYDQNSATYAKNGKSLLRSYPKSHKILAICRAK